MDVKCRMNQSRNKDRFINKLAHLLQEHQYNLLIVWNAHCKQLEKLIYLQPFFYTLCKFYLFIYWIIQILVSSFPFWRFSILSEAQSKSLVLKCLLKDLLFKLELTKESNKNQEENIYMKLYCPIHGWKIFCHIYMKN